MDALHPLPSPCVRTLKKLLIKMALRAEVERFRANPQCWKESATNPLLHRTVTALLTCPLLSDAPVQAALDTLPALAVQWHRICGNDLLISIANELGNMWTLLLVSPGEEEQADDEELFDEEAEEEEDSHLAQARALRLRSMRSLSATLAHISADPGGFEAVYQRTIHATHPHELADEPLRDACLASFDALDFVVHQALQNNEQDYRRKMRQLSSPLLSLANPFRVAPFFARFSLHTGLAELLTLRGARHQLAQLERGLPPAHVAAIHAYVDSGRANKSVAKLGAADVAAALVPAHQVLPHRVPPDHMADPHAPHQVPTDPQLALLRHAALVWQRRETVRLCRGPEATLLLDHVFPAVGAPLAALYDALRVGDEMRALATLLHDAPASLPQLRARLFTSATAALRREQQVKTLLRWLYDAMRDPLVVDLPALIARAHLDPAALAREVEHARCRLRAC